MKYLVRLYLFSVFSLWFVQEIIPGFTIPGSTVTLLSAGLALSLLTLIVKPMLKILFIPVNMLTFGLSSWVVHVIVIYLLIVIVPEVRIEPWVFPGMNVVGFVIPKIQVSYYASLIVVSVLITFITNVLHGVSES